MKYKILLLAFSAAVLTSCSTYKAGQTPDDVYYSPARDLTAREEVRTERRDRYEEYVSSQDDQYLRRKIQNREKWSEIDDYSYWYDSRYNYYNDRSYYNNFSYNNYNSLYNPYSYNPYGYNLYSYNSWSYSPFNQGYYGYGGYYSPLYPVVFYKNPKVYTGTTGKSNLTTFQNRNYSNVNTPGNYSNSKGRNSETNFGNLMKRVFTTPSGTSNTNNQQSTSWDRPVRTMEPTSTPSSSAGGRSGGYNSTGTSTSTGRPPR